MRIPHEMVEENDGWEYHLKIAVEDFVFEAIQLLQIPFVAHDNDEPCIKLGAVELISVGGGPVPQRKFVGANETQTRPLAERCSRVEVGWLVRRIT